MNHKTPFQGRSISVVNDLSVEEQLYMYRQTAALKEALLKGGDLSPFMINNKHLSVYLMFFENSTRTRESFRNAAGFHNVRLNPFDVQSSSVKKQESVLDTIKMLFGYSSSSIFIIRSTLEGVCKYLEEEMSEYAEKLGLPVPSFINAGDGKHEHPTQEFLDEFSFLEQNNWDNSSIHLALTGDLFHGRTVHSKADGLKVFNEVKLDLIAPEELAMPEVYKQKMLLNGFKIREFESLDEYLEQKDIAPSWYFTRLQLERMGDDVLGKEHILRKAVSIRRDMMDKIPETTRFYHPLPRHKVYPVIPSFLDKTPFNAWDEQSRNGYYTRIMEISLLGGLLPGEFKSKTTPDTSEEAGNFVENVILGSGGSIQKQDTIKVGIKPVENGIVIDHISKNKPLDEIWNQIDKIRRLMNFNCRSSHGVFHTDNPEYFKGIISLPDILSFTEKQLKMLAAISPGCTLNMIKDRKVINKFRMHMPPAIYNFDEISCKNENCVSYKDNHECSGASFVRHDKDNFVCRFCEKKHSYGEIWDIH